MSDEPSNLPFYEVVNRQRQFFRQANTLHYNQRINILKDLLQVVKENEQAILTALAKDLHKSTFEAWAVEYGVIMEELRLAIRHLREWMQPKRLKTPLLHFRANSSVLPVPFGHVLIIAPWNYPFMLALRPAIGAIAAGNAVLIKPADAASATEALLENMINHQLNTPWLQVAKAGPEESARLMEHRFDFVFFTGGTEIGRKVYQAAAQHLTPVVLELGGKNPCIVHHDADLTIAARRIAWGKFSNGGQTCASPDYLLIHESVYEQFIQKLIQQIRIFYGDDPQQHPDYGRIINKRHWERIMKLIPGAEVLAGGTGNEADLYIAPTIIRPKDTAHPSMQEEVFGPVLPIFTYQTIDEAYTFIDRHPDPLAMYLFSKDRKLADKLSRDISSGDFVVNEQVIHFGHIHLPIGGKGNSGFGKYQGKHSFDIFSHQKSIYRKFFFPDLPVRYPPYTTRKFQMIKALFRIGYR